MKYKIVFLVLVCGVTNVSHAKDVAIGPTCANNFDYVPEKKECKINAALEEKLKDVNKDLSKIGNVEDKKKICKESGASFNDESKQCAFVIPVPTCGDLTGRVHFKEDGTCVQASELVASDNSNLINDCFILKSKVAGVPPEISDILVISESDDKTTLNVQKATKKLGIYCKNGGDNKTELMQVNKSELLSSGSIRKGWVYGVLTLPYKIYTKDHTLSSSAMTVGPYLGARTSLADVGFTYALSVGLTQSNAFARGADGKYVLDANGDPIENKQTGITAAMGLMFDVSKSAKPLKLGIFYGRDYFSNSESGKIPHGGENWVALQVGFDFTD